MIQGKIATTLATMILLGLVTGACSRSSHSTASETSTSAREPSSTSTTDPIDYGAKYLAIAARVNSEALRFQAGVNTLGDNPQAADLARFATPFANALERFDAAVLAVKWPGATEADVKALVTADAALIGDLRTASSQTVFSAASWVSTTVGDESKLGAAVAIVRSDLSLPPAKS